MNPSILLYYLIQKLIEIFAQKQCLELKKKQPEIIK